MFRRIYRNTSAQLIGRLVSAVSAFVSTLLLAHALGSVYFGEYTKIIVFITLFYPAVDFGFNTIFIKEGRDRVEKKFASFFSFRIFLGIFYSVIAVSIGWLLALLNRGFSPLVLQTIILASGAIVGYSVLLAVQALFQSRQRFAQSTVGLTIGSSISTGVLLILYPLLKAQPTVGVVIAICLFILGIWGSALVQLFLARNISITFQVDKSQWFSWFKESVPLGVTLLFNIIYFRVDTLFLSIYRTSAEVGAYGFAYKFFEFALVIPAFFMNSVYPELVENKEKPYVFRKLMYHSYVFLFLAACCFGLLLWWAAPLLGWFKADFYPSIDLLRLLVLGLPIFYLTSPLMWWFVLKNKQKQLAFLYGGSMIFNVVFNFLFIPTFGAKAAAIITGITEFVVLLLGFIYSKNHP